MNATILLDTHSFIQCPIKRESLGNTYIYKKFLEACLYLENIFKWSYLMHKYISYLKCLQLLHLCETMSNSCSGKYVQTTFLCVYEIYISHI
jgi:hypothetical protein